MAKTYYEKWRIFTDSLVAPDNYIDFGFYYLIAASLQRRVWVGPDHRRLYPNIYVIAVGEPGIGKGITIKQVSPIIRHHKLINPKEFTNRQLPCVSDKLTKDEKALAEHLHTEDYEVAEKEEKLLDSKQQDKRHFDKPLLLPVAADATTYEALTDEMAKSLRRINYVKEDGKLGIYMHSSLCFCLEEISSLFRKRTEDLVHFLLQAYDCGDYKYKTKTQGTTNIKNCCLNFFGGTTPGFMQQVFNDQLLTEGFASRCFFLFASSNRKTQLFSPDLTAEQEQYRQDIIEMVLSLTKLYGRVKYTDDCVIEMERWWKEAQFSRPNTNVKLNPYYARKDIHVQKMMMAIHFSESTEMLIDTPTFKKALALLNEEEKRMHNCLGLDKANPLAQCTRKILQFLQHNHNKDFSFGELITEFWEALPGPDHKDNLKVVLDHLEMTKRIYSFNKEHPILKTLKVHYKVMKETLNGNGEQSHE